MLYINQLNGCKLFNHGAHAGAPLQMAMGGYGRTAPMFPPSILKDTPVGDDLCVDPWQINIDIYFWRPAPAVE